MKGSGPDAVVVGSGPNGLAAAVTLARAGRSVLVREAAEAAGGGTRSEELTLPGFLHDVCSAIHPFVPGSPFFRDVPLRRYGLELVESPAVVAHPFDDGTAALLERSVEATAAGLGPDRTAYRRLFGPLAAAWPSLEDALLGPLVAVPRHPLALTRFALLGLRPARSLARAVFAGEPARGLLAGCAAHSMLPLEKTPSAAFGLVLAAAGHLFGWPFPRGGARRIADALTAVLAEHGGVVETGAPVESLDDVGPTRAVFCDVGPPALARLAGTRLPERFRRRLARFRYGPGAFKLDYALAGPIPWKAPECARAATVHLGGTLDEIAASERAPWRGEHADRPFVLLAQHTLFDSGRAPEGKHTAWAYCHVPNGSTVDMTERIEAQIERFAPGFRDLVLARHALGPAGLERRNPNLVGGDLNGGAADLRGLLARPVASLLPYRTPAPGVWLCSASTPPGGGVHGMCGYLAARAALPGGLERAA
ncbi:MAG TPA: NAD(P)/FAD-dependent oxidoreductase [Gaiellaceae bacterium]|nr:NAD(P)/FAD-dependent oxidoreductase [Gaiellaceae bacterium]